MKNFYSVNNTMLTRLWNSKALTVNRNNPTFLGLANTLNLTSAQIDSIFTAASKIIL